MTTPDGHRKTVFAAVPKILPSAYPCFFPAMPSDGSFVVYQRDISIGIRDIVLQDIQSGKLEQISIPTSYSMSPSISFDDRVIAFTSKVDNNWDVYTFDRRTHTTARVTTNLAQDFAPAFTPEGTVVFASDRKGHFQLYEGDDSKSVTSIVKGPTLLTPTQGGSPSFYAPSFSGDIKIKQAKMPSMVQPARSSFGSAIIDNKIFVVGGHQGPEHTYPKESFTNRVDFFDLKDRAWHSGAPRIYGAHGFGLASYHNFIYAFGGFTYSKDFDPQWTSLDIIERYDISRNTWSVIGHLPHKRSSNVVAQVGSRVYLIGGWDSTPKFKGDLDGTFQASVDVFDLDSEKAFTTSLILPNPLRRAFTGVVLGTDIILIGGIGQRASHFELLSHVTALDTTTGVFRELSPLPFGTFAPAAGVIGQTVFVFGGMLQDSNNDFSYINHIYELKPNEPWVSTGRYLSETKGFSQVLNIGQKTLGILGGHNEEGEGATNGPISSFEIFGL